MNSQEIYNGRDGNRMAEDRAKMVSQLLHAKRLVAKDEESGRIILGRLDKLTGKRRNFPGLALSMEEMVLKDFLTALIHEQGVSPREMDANFRNYHDYSEEWTRRAIEEIADLVIVAE